MNKNVIAISAVAALLMGSNAVIAHEAALDGDIAIEGDQASGYVNAKGNALRTGTGECLILGGLNDDNGSDACNGIEAKAEEPAPEPEPTPTPEVAKEPIVSIATLGGQALFATNSADLNGAGQEAIANLVEDLSKFQEISQMVVTGHTDSRGSEAYNQDLSEKRANTVKAYLENAYPSVPVSAIGAGENSPRETNATAEGRQSNRRVEIQVTAKSITE
ncbi:MAG: OmpA family protein [Granulosicoccaceae bacterium]